MSRAHRSAAMKILIVTSTWKPELSGIAEATFSRVMELGRSSACRIRVLAPDYSAYASLLPDYRDYLGKLADNVEVETYPTRVVRSVASVSTEARLALPFWRYSFRPSFDAFQPDLIHVEEPCRMFGLRLFDGHLKRVGAAYKQRHGIPITCMWRTDYFEYAKTVYSAPIASALTRVLRPAFAWVYNAYDKTFCSSEVAHAKLTWAGVRNLVVVPAHGIDLDRFKRTSETPNDGLCKLLYVGRVSKEKNVPQLLTAFSALAARYPELRLDIVGSGPLLGEVREAHADNPRVVFHGKMSNEQLPEFYSRSDIFVNPSQTETFGLSTLEACACSLPVVVADRGGFLTAEDEQRLRCLRYAHGDAADLANKIERLILDRKLRARLASAAREVAAAYDSASVARNFYQQWLELSGTRATGRLAPSSPARAHAVRAPGLETPSSGEGSHRGA